MSKQWWLSRAGFTTQGVCLLVLFVWSVARHTPSDAARSPRPAEPEIVIDNSEDNAVADNTATSEADARFVAPPTVRFRTDNPPAGSLNPRPVEVSSPEHSAPWQPLHPQNPPRRVPGGTAPRTPFEVSGNGATVYNAPPPEAD